MTLTAKDVQAIVRELYAQYNLLLAKANKLGKAGKGIASKIFSTKNRLLGICTRLRSMRPETAINLTDLRVSTILAYFKK